MKGTKNMYLAGLSYSDKSSVLGVRSSGLLRCQKATSVKLNLSCSELQISDVRFQLLETHPCLFNWLTAGIAT